MNWPAGWKKAIEDAARQAKRGCVHQANEEVEDFGS
jgi:hypothetical protein